MLHIHCKTAGYLIYYPTTKNGCRRDFPQFLLQYFPVGFLIFAQPPPFSPLACIPPISPRFKTTFPFFSNSTTTRWKNEEGASKQTRKNKTIEQWFTAKTKQWPGEIFHRMIEWTIAKNPFVNNTNMYVCYFLRNMRICIVVVLLLHATKLNGKYWRTVQDQLNRYVEWKCGE